MLLRRIASIWCHAPCCLGAYRNPANYLTGDRPIHRSKLIAGSLTGCLLLSSLQAQSLREPQFMSEARPGFDAIYSLDYDHAERIFTALKKAYPQHPAPPLYLATIIWFRELWRRQDLDLDRFISPGFFARETGQVMPEQERRDFFDRIRESQALAQKILDGDFRNTDALYFMGASYGILGSFSITVDHSLRSAFRYGSKAYDYDRRVIKIDPKYYDAYMTVGLYEYIVGSIPWWVKPFAMLAGYFGSKDQGFKYVALVVSHGDYVKTEAKVLEMVLWMHEGRPANALHNAQELHRDYPHNYIFQLNIAQIMEQMGETEQAITIYLDVLRNAEEGKPNYNQVPMAAFRYYLGSKLFKMGRLPAAQEQFQKCLAHPGASDRDKALSFLRLGQILDLLGRREEAVEAYLQVLQIKDIENSRALARKCLNKPYRG
jgi:tetratricopeptide (TPR) repeat protein